MIDDEGDTWSASVSLTTISPSFDANCVTAANVASHPAVLFFDTVNLRIYSNLGSLPVITGLGWYCIYTYSIVLTDS